mmetsp:Transcript_46385/g.119979  ORF Transcript_46385/g.119979 Transcript_46385/m.119979 type:complete len:228 (+) Transcript_46385:57-740(+)
MARSRSGVLGRAVLLCAAGAAVLLAQRGGGAFAAAGRRGVLGAVLAAGGAQVARAEDGDIVTFTVQMNGDQGGTGQVQVRLRPDWAPRGVKRFQELVKMGEMTNSAVFHVDEDTAHFGLPAEPSLVPDKIKDDIVRSSNRRGTLTFASGGQNARVNQLFFNTDDNKYLDSQGFAPIGEVVGGMEIVDKFYKGYGEKPKRGKIVDEGNKYLDPEFPKLSKIKSVKMQG